MHKIKKMTAVAVVSVLMIISIYYSSDVVRAANEAVTLCLQTIIPSIFPFLFISMVLCNCWMGIRIPLLSPLCNMTGIPENAQSILLLAVIGGYPVGAQAVATAWQDGQLSKKHAQRLLGFCNNAGPSFIFGLIGSMFDRPLIGLVLWLIHISTALFVGSILPDRVDVKTLSGTSCRKNLSHHLQQTIRITTVICGWVILFRVLLVMISQWVGTLDTINQSVLFGLFELTNGCVMLPQIPMESIRFIVAAGLIGIGGLCVTMQTKAVVGALGLGMYFPGKLMQTSLSILFSTLLAPVLFSEVVIILPAFMSLLSFVFTYIAIKRKK